MDVVEQPEHRSLVWPGCDSTSTSGATRRADGGVPARRLGTRPAFRRLAEDRLATDSTSSRRTYAATAASGGSRPGPSRRISTTCSRPSPCKRGVWLGHSFGGRLVPSSRRAGRPARVRDSAGPGVPGAPARRLRLGPGGCQGVPSGRPTPPSSRDWPAAARPRAQRSRTKPEHLDRGADGLLRWRYAARRGRDHVQRLCREPLPRRARRSDAARPRRAVRALERGPARGVPAPLGDRLELVTVPGGHMVYWDAFDETADAVEKFLIRHSPVSHA